MQLTDAFYYLENFRSMLETLMRRDGDLLLPEESNFIGNFFRLSKRPGALLVRLVMRKGPLFRARRLVYPEIGGVEEAVQPLIDLRWVEARPVMTVPDLFALYSKAEVVHHLGLPAHRRRTARLGRQRRFVLRDLSRGRAPRTRVRRSAAESARPRR